VTEGERDDDRVVELASDGDEVGDEVERQRQLADEGEQQQLAATRNTRLARQPRHEHDAVGDECRERPCFVAPPDEYERWKKHLAQAEVELIEEADSDGVRSLYFKDPAGNVLEIADGDMWPQ
jgi:catechol 2,3-dioxygenase-like lactoylglutathione lyase family enzyme